MTEFTDLSRSSFGIRTWLRFEYLVQVAFLELYLKMSKMFLILFSLNVVRADSTSVSLTPAAYDNVHGISVEFGDQCDVYESLIVSKLFDTCIIFNHSTGLIIGMAFECG